MSTPLPIGLFGGVVEWWQLVLLALLIALIIFWKIYRNKQM